MILSYEQGERSRTLSKQFGRIEGRKGPRQETYRRGKNCYCAQRRRNTMG